MAAVDEIMSLIRKGPELITQTNSINTKSVARGAKDSTFQFPCLIVNSVPSDTGFTMARTLEPVYATFTQSWISMNSMYDMTIDPTPLSYLKRLHQNLRLEKAIEDLTVDNSEIDHYMEKVYDGSYKLYLNESKDFGILFNVKDHATKMLMESHRDGLKEYLSEYNTEPIEVTEAPEDSVDFMNSYLAGVDKKAENDLRNKQLTASTRGIPVKMAERDLKKSNDLMPYLLQARLIAVNDKKEFVQYVDISIGIKVILHVIDSEDMVENIARALQNKSTMFRFLKWTTGEISFVKDFLLNIGDMKTDVINKYSGKSPFFGVFKRLKQKKLGLRNFTVPHAIIPNATIVISTYEVDYLVKQFGIDLREASVAKKLMETLFLMTFAIIDDGAGIVSIFYDGGSDFETYSLDVLERDATLTANKLGKEIGRIMTR